MMRLLLCHIALILAAAACTPAASRHGADPAPRGAAKESVPLPAVPGELTDPAARADWLCAHFWDSLDMADRSRSLDTAYMEQSFANFASVLPLASSDESRMRAVEAVMSRAESAGADVRDRLLEIAQLYLYEPESPVYDENLYAFFARYAAEHVPGRAVAARAALDDIARNAPGTRAPDIRLQRPDGSTVHLLRGASRQAGIILFFYEPGCERCAAAKRLLAGDAVVSRAVTDGALRVVMVCLDADTHRRAWLRDAESLPPGWETGLDADGEADEGYTVRATPSLYLLHPDGTVILKDAPAPLLLQMLGSR